MSFIRKHLNYDQKNELLSKRISVLPEMLAAGVEANPRKIKRLYYSLELIWEIVINRQTKKSDSKQPLLIIEIIAKLVLIQQRDPALYLGVRNDHD